MDTQDIMHHYGLTEEDIAPHVLIRWDNILRWRLPEYGGFIIIFICLYSILTFSAKISHWYTCLNPSFLHISTCDGFIESEPEKILSL